MIFKNRIDGGKELAEKLIEFADVKNVLILALPRGGVPVAFEVAKRLNAPLDVFVGRKFGVPENEELALAADASGSGQVLNKSIIKHLKISDSVAEKENIELKRREREYRESSQMPEICEKTVFLIDDGLATGAAMKAAVVAIRQMKPAKIVVAIPVASPETFEEFQNDVDEIICAVTPQPFYGIGKWYEDFTQITDLEVREFLKKAKEDLSVKAENLKDKTIFDYRRADLQNGKGSFFSSQPAKSFQLEISGFPQKKEAEITRD